MSVNRPPAAYLAALASLPGAGPARLRAVLRRWPNPQRCWQHIGADEAAVARLVGPTVAAAWHRALPEIAVDELWQRYRDAGVSVVDATSPTYPFAEDLEPPAVVFMQGSREALDARRVAIVGTRRCTRYGLEVANELGAVLARSGIAVVSGLALGIDAAAHAGALGAGGAAPIAVVGSGHDRPYPARNRALWRRVAAAGLVLGEAPLGAEPQRWRFPARNRLIAALAEVVVVVESHATGGSLSTVAEAASRDRAVFAVPGPIRSAASAGTNRLLADGCMPLCGVDDVFVALDLVAAPADGTGPTVRVDAADRSMLDVLGWSPWTIDEAVAVTDLDLGDAAARVERLVAVGALVRRGPFYERTAVRIGDR